MWISFTIQFSYFYHCRHCAFIMHTSSENFMCYVFHVEPSAGPMAKTIEAACKLRYQKVLDAHSNGHLPVNGKVNFIYFDSIFM